MNKFHRKCGDRVTLFNQNLTAIRNFVEFNHGLVLSADPLIDGVLFEVRIDRKVNVWNGSLEIGVTTLDPEFLELPATATKLRNTAWILSGNSIVKDGNTIASSYGPELDSLRESDCIAVSRSSKGELMFFINGSCLGVAAKDLPSRLFAVIDLYGQCVQVSIIHCNYSRPIMDQPYESTASDLATGGLVRTHRDTHIQLPLTCPLVTQDNLRFHPRCGILVKLSNNNKSAERARPLDDYNNGVVMTHRPLYDNECFEIRIDKLVDKWSGSIEVGVTTHNPATIRFPSTMTNMDTGTIMMSGCKVLMNGQGACMEYGNFNLDELREGDTVGMMRRGNGRLHYFINGVDQGVATDKVPPQVWGVVDLYGMTVKVTVVDPCEDLDSNINEVPVRMLAAAEAAESPDTSPALQPAPDTPVTAVTIPEDPPPFPSTSTYEPPPACAGLVDEEELLFHTLRDSHVIIFNDGRTAHRPNAFEDFDNGFVMTNRTLKTNELFQVRLDLVIPKWAGSIEIGITQHSSNDIKLPFRMNNATSGTWGITGEDVIQDGNIIIPQYVRNLTRLVEGDTVGVMRKDMGILHFFVNGIDQGPAAFNIPEHVFGIVDLYGRVAQATIVDTYTPPQVSSPESPLSLESNATVLPEMCFHSVHGHNARLSRNRLTASRVTVYSEFNDAVLFSSRPMRECDMFEIRVDKMIDCWIGSLEIGVTAIRPEDLDSNGSVGALAGTATDLSWDTYILSGSAMMKDGECVRSGYQLNLDTITVGSRVGMMWHADRSIHYYLDGMDMGKAWHVPHLNIYAVVDLYGQCTQVTILQNEERAFNYNGCNTDHAILANPRAVPTPPQPYWSFSEYHGGNVSMSKDLTMARRLAPDPMGALVFSSAHLILGEMYEIQILECKQSYAGSFRIGVTDVNVLNAIVNRNLPLCASWLPHFTAYIDGRYMKYTLPNSTEHDIHSFVPSFDWLRPGDRIGLKKTADSKVLVYYNSELLDVAFEKVPDKVYVLMEMYGPTTKIQTVSRGTKIVPANQQTIPNDKPELQDVAGCLVEAVPPNTEAPPSAPTAQSDNQAPETCEAVDEPEPPTPPQSAIPEENSTSREHSEPGADDVESGVSLADYRPADVESGTAARDTHPTDGTELETRRRGALPYTFHYMTGNNIRLCSSDTVAVRYRGFADAVAVASQPLHRGQAFRFRVDKVTDEWQGTVTIGALAMLPSEMPPISALHFTIPCWFVSNDVLYHRGVYTLSEVGRKLEEITENSVLTLHFRASSELTLEIDGVNRGVIATIPRRFNDIYPAIDLYGRILQVSILLHPHVLLSGTSLDLPMIEEHREDVEARDTTDLDSDETDREPVYNFPNLSFSDPDDEFSFRHEQDNPDLEYYPTDADTYPNNISFYPENISTNVGYKVQVVENAVEDISNANEDVSANVNGDVSNMNGDVSNVNDVSNANDDISTNMNGDVSNANDDVSNTNGDVSNTNYDVSNANDDISANVNDDVSANMNDYVINVNDDVSGNDVDDVSSAVDDTSNHAVDDTGSHPIDDSNVPNDEFNVVDLTTVTNNVIDVNQTKEFAANDKYVEVELRGKLEPRAGPSSAPDALSTLMVHLGNNDVNNKKIKAFKTSNKDRRSWPFKTSLHRSLPQRDDCTADNDLAVARGLKKSHSTQHFTQKLEAEFVSVDSDESSSGESIVNPLSLGSHIFDDDSDASEEVEEVCDTNIRHNDRYPEANETVCSNDYDASDAIDDNFDNVFIDAMFLETNNMPDLNEEQSLSMDESTTTRRDDLWADGLTIENLHYLNGIICWDQRVTGARVEHRDWVFYSETNGNCEVMHLALKFWNQIVAPYSDMREVVTSGCVHCFCSNCSPDADPLYGGWVRIERTRASEVECERPVRMYWHVMRATITSALALSDVTLADMRRPRSFCHEPSTSPALADTWMDEEGKPHQAALALDVDIGGREAESDRLIAYWIYLKSHASMLQEACEDVEDTVEDAVDDILEDTVDDIVAMFDDNMEETADGSDRLDPSRSGSTESANPLQ